MKLKKTLIALLILCTLPFSSFANSRIILDSHMFKEPRGDLRLSDTELEALLRHYNELKQAGNWTPSGNRFKLPENLQTGPVDMTGGRVDTGTALVVGRGVIDAYVQETVSHVGKPYQWGAIGPNKFDCSGLMLYSLKKFNVTMPRVSRDQAKVGQRVNRLEDLQKGDLIFFDSSNRTGSASVITHVGMYIGDGNMVHAPSPGKNVVIVKVDNNYHRPRFRWGRRIVVER